MTTATINNVRLGTTIVAGDGFTCMDAGAPFDVYRDDKGLFVRCADGRHYLDGQLNGGEIYVGFTIARDAARAA
jgi:hypothetical protein